MSPSQQIVVCGAGIIGLTTAARLVKEGFKNVVIWTKEIDNTTSEKCGGLWEPFQVAEGMEEVLTFAKETLDVLKEELDEQENGEQHKGLGSYPNYTMFKKVNADFHNLPNWGALVDMKKIEKNDENEENYFLDNKDFVAAWYFDCIICDMKIYMRNIREFLLDSGVDIVKLENCPSSLDAMVAGVEEHFGDQTLIINCTGLFARRFCNDSEIYPGRGVVLKVNTPEDWNPIAFMNNDINDLFYVLPNPSTVTFGGTYEANNYNEKATCDEIMSIIGRITKVVPELGNSTIVETWSGLRPARNRIRIEFDEKYSNVLHNYGHGGAGFTLCWGSANKVLKMIQKRSNDRI